MTEYAKKPSECSAINYNILDILYSSTRGNESMDNMVDIEVIIDDTCVDPKIKIHTKEKTRQIDNIIYAIENVTENDGVI